MSLRFYLPDVRKIALVCLVVGPLFGCGPTKPAADGEGAKYKLTIIEVPANCLSSDSAMINRSGVVAGFQAARDGGHTGLNDPYVPSLYQDNRLKPLGTLGGWRTDIAGINSTGSIAGWSLTADANFHAVRIVDGKLQDLGTLAGDASFAHAINSLGDVVGTSGTSAPSAFIFRKGRMSDLNNSIGRTAPMLNGQTSHLSGAYGINDRGDLLLQVDPKVAIPGKQAWSFLYTNGAFVDLDKLAAPALVMRFQSLNSRGDFTGTMALPSGDYHAFLYAAGKIVDLGSLAKGFSWGEAVNDQDEVVGSSGSTVENNFGHAFLWENGKMHDLNKLVDSRDLVVHGHTYALTRATGINDDGQIVGTARYDAGTGGCHVDQWGVEGDAGTAGFVLTPEK